MSDTRTPGCGSNSDARKRHVESLLERSSLDTDAAVTSVDPLRGELTAVYRELLARRSFWAARHGEADAARAVAYQSAAGLLQRALEADDV